MLNKKVIIVVVCSVSMGFVAATYAGFWSGPLTGTAAAKKTVKPASKGTDSSGMPVPAATQFQSAPGGAPTASVVGQAVNGPLPPVVDAEPGPGGQTAVDSAPQVATPSAPAPSTYQVAQVNTASAGAPVANVAQASNTVVAAPITSVEAAVPPGSVDQRLAKVEQQLNNLVRMNLPQQISDLQMQLQQLSGQLQVQEHDLKLLNTQQRSFYQDLDQRIKKLSGASDDGGDSDKSAPAPGSAKSTAPKVPSKASSQHQEAMNNIELQDSSAYKKSLDLVIKRRYDDAVQSLNQYLNNFPNGVYKDKAHYWLGEIYYLKKSYKQSQTEFNLVIKDSPKSPRVPDAKLKIALIHLQTGQEDQAKKELSAVKNSYPNSTAAQLAIIQLKQLDL